jgi:hypothetical protein
MMMTVEEDPPPLGQVKPGVPKNLEPLVMKCLERKPERPYDSARALAEDLRRVALWTARAHRLRPHHDFVLGRDAHPSLEAAMEVIRTASGEPPRDAWMLAELLLDRVLEAGNAQRQGRNPAPALEKARTLLRKLGELDKNRALKTCQAATRLSPLLTPKCQES